MSSFISKLFRKSVTVNSPKASIPPSGTSSANSSSGNTAMSASQANASTSATAAATSGSSSSSKVEALYYDVVILGTGVGCGYACKSWVDNKDKIAAGLTICAIGEEGFLPYERPALTKAKLHGPDQKIRARYPGFVTCKGSGGDGQLEDFYEKNGIKLYQNERVTSCLVKDKVIETESGKKFKFDKLIIATGARPRLLDPKAVPGCDLGNVLTIRNEKDADKVVSKLESISSKAPVRAFILGGGFIGVEVAAALLSWGAKVTLVTPTDHILPGIFIPAIATRYEEELKKRGINVLCKTNAVSFSPSDSDASIVGKVKLSDGSEIDCDVVVVGIGAIPNNDLFVNQVEMAAPTAGGGVLVNEYLRTSAPDVYAIGDVAAFPCKSHGYRRLEHVDNARKMANYVIKSAVAGETNPFENETPYFYSRILEYSPEPWIFQMYGNSKPSTVAPVFFEGVRPNSFGCIWVSEGPVVQGGLLVNGVKEEYDALKLLVERRTSVSSLDVLSAEGLAWKSLL